MQRCEASTMQPPPDLMWGCRGASSLPHRGGVHRTEDLVDIAVLLSLALDGDAVILTRAAMLEFSLQINRSKTCCAYYQ
jgi:hypothetical protein